MESISDVGDLGLFPGSGRSPGGGRGDPLQSSCLENHMDNGAWQIIVHGVAKSPTRLSIAQSSVLITFLGGWGERNSCVVLQVRHRCCSSHRTLLPPAPLEYGCSLGVQETDPLFVPIILQYKSPQGRGYSPPHSAVYPCCPLGSILLGMRRG